MELDPRRQIWPIFVEETREHLQYVGECLLALEKPPSERPAGLMAGLLRALHTMKGGAGSLSFSHFERLSHAMEGALARQPPESQLPRAVVDGVLRALSLLESLLRRVDEGLEEEAPAELEAVLAALEGHEEKGSPPPPSAPPAPEHLPDELWPIFRGEVAEALSLLGEAMRGERGPADQPELARLRELSDVVQQSGATLGVPALEQLGAQVRSQLDAPWAAETAGRVRQQLSHLERLVAQQDERLEQLVRAAPAPPPPMPPASPSLAAIPGFFVECEGLLTQAEQALARLLTPDEQQRSLAQLELRQLTHRLEGTTRAVMQGDAAELAAELRQTAGQLGQGGVEGAVASAHFARLIVAFREALKVLQTAAPKPSAAPPQKAPAEKGRAPEAVDSVIRVSRNAVETLTDVLDRAAMSRARRETQLRTLLELRGLSQEAVLWAERASSELRMLEVHSPLLLGARDRLRELSQGMKQVAAALWRDLESERIQGAQLKDTLRELRTVPAHTLGELLRRTARDAAGRVGKNVRLELVGGEVRLDRRIVDAVRDPLLHLLRNAVDHGLEAPQTRLQRGKNAEGCLTLSIEQRGGRVIFSLSDDGGGLDLEAIRERARARGLYEPRALAAMSEAEVSRLIFLPGFSTAKAVTELSGRGVGLDVVESLAVSLGGAVTVEHVPGQGTTFRVDLPRALGAVLGLVARVGSQLLVLPNDAVVRLLRLTSSDLSVVGEQPMARVGEELLPFVSLARLLGLPGGRMPLEDGEPVVTVVLASGSQQLALGVDAVEDHQELVVHALGKHLKDSRHFSGAAQLNDGTVVPVLQVSEVILMATQLVQGGAAVKASASILVVDDALSTRAAIRAVLEIAGFAVLAAADGEEAWQLMQTQEVSLLITDLQMPRLDGLGLTRRVRADPRWVNLPVVVVTAQDSAEDRSLGLDAGADAYLVKHDIERGALLQHVRQLLVVDP